MRYLVIGAGAIGSVLGGFLRKAGHDVTLLGRAAHVGAIRERGLRIEGIWGELRADGFGLAERPEDLPDGAEWDAVLVTTKAYDAAAAAAACLPRINRDAAVIVVQNGLGGVEEVAAVAGRERTAACRVIFGVEVPEPGAARVTVCADDAYVGDYFGSGNPALIARAEAFAEELSAAGIATHPTDAIVGHLWAKFLYNCALNGLGALLGARYGLLLESAATRRLMERIVGEIFAAARAEGAALFWKTPEEYRDLLFGRLIPVTYDHRPSMLQDLERGRRTEIEYMNGHAARLAEKWGLEAPVNRTVAEMVRFREAFGREGERG